MTPAIWKWRTGWPFRSASLVMRRSAEDRAPMALTRFDAAAIADEIRQRLGDPEVDEDAPFIITA
jgi:hypothetical protein